MKNYILLFISVILFSCSSEVTKVTWDDPKSIAIKTLYLIDDNFNTFEHVIDCLVAICDPVSYTHLTLPTILLV